VNALCAAEESASFFFVPVSHPSLQSGRLLILPFSELCFLLLSALKELRTCFGSGCDKNPNSLVLPAACSFAIGEETVGLPLFFLRFTKAPCALSLNSFFFSVFAI